MNWSIIDKEYIKYLSQFDSKVGYVEYGDHLKLHIGILLTIEDFHYYVPISSAKSKHFKMSNSLDFHKLQEESSGYIYAVVNLNNMIPVPSICVKQLKYDQIENYRLFHNEKEKTNYIYLLQKEKALIDKVENTLQAKASKLYQKCISYPNSLLASRCCNFKLLEEKCSLYTNNPTPSSQCPDVDSASLTQSSQPHR